MKRRTPELGSAVLLLALTASCAPAGEPGAHAAERDAPAADAPAEAPAATGDATPTLVSFPTSDGGVIQADRYGSGDRAVVLAHGARFDKESWSDQAKVLAAKGFLVLAIDFRGYGDSRGGSEARGLYLDVLGAVRWLRENGAKEVDVVGGSMGGAAAARASAASKEGDIDRLVLLAPAGVSDPEHLKGRKLFLVARDDPVVGGPQRLPILRDEFDRAPEPKEMVVVDGSAHAQNLFATDQGPRVLDEIVRFLSAP